MRTLTIASEGITCTGCVTDIENLLREVQGILEVVASYSAGTIQVGYDPGRIDPKGVVLAVRRLGLDAAIAGDP